MLACGPIEIKPPTRNNHTHTYVRRATNITKATRSARNYPHCALKLAGINIS